MNIKLGGGFRYFLFSPRSLGKWSRWRAYFSNGLVQSPTSRQPTAVASLQHQTIHFLDARTERRNQKMEVLTLSNTVICLLSRVLSEGFRWCSPFFFSTWETCFQLGYRQIFFQMDWHCRLYILIWRNMFLHLIHMFFDWSSYFPYCCVNQFLLQQQRVNVLASNRTIFFHCHLRNKPKHFSLGWIPMETCQFFGGLSQFPPISSFSLAGVCGLAGRFFSFLPWYSSALLRKLRLQRFMVDAMRWQELTMRWFKENNTLNLNVDWLGFLRCFFLGVLGVDVRRYWYYRISIKMVKYFGTHLKLQGLPSI